jgi:hypothetical protein
MAAIPRPYAEVNELYAEYFLLDKGVGDREEIFLFGFFRPLPFS